MKHKKKNSNKLLFLVGGVVVCVVAITFSFLIQEKQKPPTKTRASELISKQLIFMGDSISTAREDGYAKLLSKKIGVNNSRFIAVQGSKTEDLFKQFTPITTTNNPSDSTLNIQYVFITSGGNDVMEFADNPRGLARSIAKALSNIRLFITSNTDSNTHFFIATVYNPLQSITESQEKKCGILRPDEARVFNLQLANFSKQLKGLAQNNKVTIVDLYSLMADNKGLIRDDCIHPNVEGHKKIMEEFYKAYTSVISLPTGAN